MARVLHNPSLADLLQAIKDEDLGITPKLTTADIKALPMPTAATIPFGTEYVAMQMAVSQCDMYANLVD